MESKSFLRFRAVSIKALDDQPEGTVEAICAVTGNEDLGRDVIIAGAFEGFIAKAKSGAAAFPRLLWDHGVNQGLAALTGKVLDLEELQAGDPRLPDVLQTKGLGGMRVVALYNLKTQPGREAYEHVKAGDVEDWSFMYEAPEKSFDAKGRRLLKTIDPIYEISNVLVGMNPETVTTGVKSLAGLLEQVEDVDDARWSAVRAKVAAIVEAAAKASGAPARASLVKKPKRCTCGDFVVEGCSAKKHANEPLAVKLADLGFETRAAFEASIEAKVTDGDPEAETKALDAYEDRQGAIRDAIQKLYPGPDGCYIWLRLTYPDRAVYDVDGGGMSGTYQCSYSIDDSGVVTLGDPVPVTITQVATPQSAGLELAGLIKRELAEDEPDFERIAWLGQVALAVKSGAAVVADTPPPAAVEEGLDAGRITAALRSQLAAELTQVASETQFPPTSPHVTAHTDGNEHLPNFARFGARPRL